MNERARDLIAAAAVALMLQLGAIDTARAVESGGPDSSDAAAAADRAADSADQGGQAPAPESDAAPESPPEDDEPGFARWGPYVGLNAAYGLSVFNDPFRDLLPLPDVALSSGNSPGLNTRVGLRFFKFMAIEAQYEWYRGFDLSLAQVELGTLSSHTLTGNVKLFLPLWSVQPYVLGGIGASWWSTEGTILQAVLAEKGNGFAGRAGGGVEIYLTRQIVLDLEATVVMITKDFETRDFFGTPTSFDRLYYLSTSAGLTYRF